MDKFKKTVGEDILDGEEKKVAVIVGASSGIGHHTAFKLLNNGYRVYNLSRTESKDSRVINILVDVEKTSSINSAMQQLLTAESRIDLFIYSAGYSMAAPLEYVKMKDITTLFNVNYFGAVKSVQKIIPVMRKQGGGRIILVSSMAATHPIAFDSYYSSSKAALNMLAKGLAMELEPFNIKVSAVMPGGTSTRFTFKRNIYKSEDVKEYAEKMQYAVKAIEKIEQNGMTPSAVADDIVTLAALHNPPSTTAVGVMNKTYKLLNKVLPDRLSDYFNKQQYEPEHHSND